MTTPPLRTPHAVFFCIGLCAVSAACAEADPYGVELRQQLQFDSNLLHAGDGVAASRDLTSVSAVRLLLDQPIGRQRLSAALEGSLHRHKNNTQLDHTGHDMMARLYWATVERIEGSMSLQQRESLFLAGLYGQAPSAQRTLLRQRDLAAQAGIGVVTQWTFEVGASASASDHAGADFANRDERRRSLQAGLRFRPGDATSLRVGGRYTDGSFPNFGAAEDDYKRADLDLAAAFVPNAVSSFDTRLSLTRERHSVQSQRQLDTWTGRLAWNWQPSGKLRVDSALWRDNSAGAAGQAVDARLATGVELKARWDATAKMQASTTLSQTRRDLDGGFDPRGGGATLRASDRTAALRLGLRWQPLRSVELGCELGRERRKADAASLGLTYPYGATSAGCTAQLRLR